MKARKDKRRTKNPALLVSVAESIGSTLGTIARKAGEAQRALTGSSVAHTKERKSKGIAHKTARPIRRDRRRPTSSAKRVARPGTARARTTSR